MQQIPLEMVKDIQNKIADLKIECGEWGQDRRYKYLLEKSLEIDIERDIGTSIYLANDWNTKALMLWVLSNWEKLQKPLLWEMENMLRPKDNQITPDMIARAREYPITQLIEFTRGKTRCISGTHEDKHPSMSLKDNFAHCFSCGYHADSIAVCMQIKNLSFQEAVKWLYS